MPDRFIPDRADLLTAEWLTEALRSGGVISAASVTSFESEPLGEGEGFVGDLVRVTLHYDQQEDGAPSTLVAKFPTAVAENRALGDMFDLYNREIRFYDELAGDVPVRKPRCYYGDMDPAPATTGLIRGVLRLLPTALVLRLMEPLGRAGGTRRYVLLLEDMAPARVGDQVAGCSVEDAKLALRHLAAVHARFWDSPRLDKIEWIDPLNQDARIAQALYGRSLPGAIEQFQQLLTPRSLEIGDWLLEHGVELMDRLSAPPRTLLHGDYRLDNLFFGDGKTPDPLCVLDWQIAGKGSALYDVAYFIGWSINAEDKGATGDLLRAYHSALVEHGVRDYDFERCERDFVLGQLLVYHRGIFLIGQMDLTHERAVRLVDATLRRTTAALPEADLSTVFD